MSTLNITHHEEDVIQVKVPLPFSLRWVNSYLLRGKNGYTLIDPGLHTEGAQLYWEQVLASLKLSYDQIEQIVLTHHHPDHYGLAGWFQEHSGGAPVYLSEIGFQQVQLLWGEGQLMTDRLVELFAQHGMGDLLCAQIRGHMDSFTAFVSPQPQVSLLRPGQSVRLGDRSYEAIHTPGHAAGHLCFYDFGRQRLFCGDHVLPQISPNVSYMPGMDVNPLGAYLNSLLEVSRLEVRTAYPGHREPFTTFSARAAELIVHHHERLALMVVHLHEPQTAYGLCRALFGDRLTIHQLRFAMAETLAHLIYLEAEGKAHRLIREDANYFQA